MSDIWETNYNSTFFLSVGTIFITGISVCLGFALKSKCSSVKLCGGCIEIVRDIDAELEEGITNQPNEPSILPLPPSILPTTNTSISNKDSIIRRGSIRNSRTLQQLIDIIKPTEPINNNVDSVINYPTTTQVELEANNSEHKLWVIRFVAKL